MKLTLIALISCLAAYLFFGPVSVNPQAWEAPTAPGYVGAFEQNTHLTQAKTRPLIQSHGPEDIVWDQADHIYTGLANGVVLRVHLPTSTQEIWANTQGRPLGMALAPNGDLIVADAIRGLLAINPNQEVTILTQSVGNSPILFADDVAVAEDGRIYFTDATTKFSPTQLGGVMEASFDDVLEHQPNGRILMYNPNDQSTTVVLSNLYFPNGIVLTNQDSEIIFAETSQYRIMKYKLDGTTGRKPTVLVENLPGFPDNINHGRDNRLWVGLVAPRDPFADAFSSWPRLRKLIKRIPKQLHPKPAHYGHLIAIDSKGNTLQNFQDPSGSISFITGAIETPAALHLTSLKSKNLLAMPPIEPVYRP